MMRSNVVLMALMLAGCGSQSGNGSNVAAPDASPTPTAGAAAPVATATADADAAADTAIRAAIDKGYGGYNTASDGSPGSSAFVNSPDFEAAWQRAVGKEGALDYDPYCQCQDFGKVRWQIDRIDVTGDTARADARIDVFGQGEWKKTWLAFRRVDGKWLVDDVSDENGKSVKAGMKAAAPGSMGVGP